MTEIVAYLGCRLHEERGVVVSAAPALIVGEQDVPRVTNADQYMGLREELMYLGKPQNMSGGLLTPDARTASPGIGLPEQLQQRRGWSGVSGLLCRFRGHDPRCRVLVAMQGFPDFIQKEDVLPVVSEFFETAQ